MGIEYRVAEAAADDPLPRHDGVYAAYGLYCSHRGGRRGFQFSPIDETRLHELVVFLTDTQELLAGVLQGVDVDRRHHRARGQSRQKAAAFHGR